MTDPVGATFGNYRIEEKLGAGGMGQVFRGRHTHLDRQVAVKVMHSNLSADPGFRGRFLQEAKAAAALAHPNIVQVFDFGEQNGSLYLVMELMTEGSLRTLLQRRDEPDSRWSLRLGLDLVRQAAAALGFAHAQGTVHRDVKPDNLLLVRSASAPGGYLLKVGDFGLARIAGGGITTAAGLVVGTPAYMSPEQCQGADLDGRSDLYSLGVVLYEVATGYLPFETKNISEAVYKHVYVAPPSPRQVKPDLSIDLEGVILRCLAKKPEDRFARAEEFIAALDGASRALPGPAETATQITTPTPPVATVLTSPGTIAAAPAPPPGSVRPAGPQVRVQDDSGQTLRTVPLGGDGLAVGRLPTNSLVLEGEGVSRHHLQIDWDGSDATVTDLGSTNGTYLAGRRLSSQMPEHWPPGLPLKVGGYWLRLELPEAVGRTELPQAPPTPTRAAPAQAPARSSGSRVGIVVEPEVLTVTPGLPSVVRATLANLGMTVDHFTTSVEGVPTAWVERPEAPVQLNPGQKATVALRVLVPRVPESRAGEHPVAIRATSREDPSESGSTTGRWTVLPFAASSLDVSPGRVRTREEAAYDVKVRNEGNGPATFDVSASDDERALAFRWGVSSVGLEPGQSTSISLAARRKRRLIGAAQTHSIQVRSEPRGGTAQSAGVQMVHLALIPPWVPPLLLLLLVGLGVFVYGLLTRGPTIESVSFTPQGPNPGQSVTIRWSVSNATGLELQPLGVKLDLAKGEHTIFEGFAGPTDLQLVATNQFGKAQEAVRIVTVAPKPDAPVVGVFKVEPARIVLVPNQPNEVVLTWETERADQVTIEPVGGVGAKGSRPSPAPSQDTVYTLIARNGSGQVERKVQLQVVLAQCTVKGAGVVLRRGPDVAHAQISVLAENAVLTPFDHSQDARWIQVEVKATGERGWIPADAATCNLTVPELPVALAEPASPLATPTPSPTSTPLPPPTSTVPAVVPTMPPPPAATTPPAPPAPVPAFNLSLPKSAAIVRTLKPTFSWTATNSVPGVTYGIDVELNTGTQWERIQGTPNNGKPRIAQTSIEVDIPGLHLGKSLPARWRVHAATDKAANQGNWQTFTLNTDPAQFQRTWIAEKAVTAVPVGDLVRIVVKPAPTPTATPKPKFTPTPSKLATPKTGVISPVIIGILLEPKISLEVEVFERCTTNSTLECSWGKKVVTYRGEPFSVEYVRSGRTNTVRMTLADQVAPAGQNTPAPKLSVVRTIPSLTPTARPTVREYLLVQRSLIVVPLDPRIPIAPVGPIKP